MHFIATHHQCHWMRRQQEAPFPTNPWHAKTFDVPFYAQHPWVLSQVHHTGSASKLKSNYALRFECCPSSQSCKTLSKLYGTDRKMHDNQVMETIDRFVVASYMAGVSKVNFANVMCCCNKDLVRTTCCVFCWKLNECSKENLRCNYSVQNLPEEKECTKHTIIQCISCKQQFFAISYDKYIHTLSKA